MQSRPSQTAFTLTEILVTLGIIVVLLALAVPAFRAITGSRSTEAAQNMVAAMLGTARARSLTIEGTADAYSYGVLFFHDTGSGRWKMCIVRRSESGAAFDADPYDRYKGWVAADEGGSPVRYLGDPLWPYPGPTPPATTPPTPPPPKFQRVLYLTKDQAESGRPMVRTYFRTDQDPASSNAPLNPGGSPTYDNTWWTHTVAGDTDTVPDGPLAEVRTLPAGVGLQLISPRASADRYVEMGIIFFDRQGRVDFLPFTINKDTALGRLLNLTAHMVPRSDWRSQMGVALFEQDTFGSLGYTIGDSYLIRPGVLTTPQMDEVREEEWLDDNATILMVGRYNGALVRGQ